MCRCSINLDINIKPKQKEMWFQYFNDSCTISFKKFYVQFTMYITFVCMNQMKFVHRDEAYHSNDDDGIITLIELCMCGNFHQITLLLWSSSSSSSHKYFMSGSRDDYEDVTQWCLINHMKTNETYKRNDDVN